MIYCWLFPLTLFLPALWFLCDAHWATAAALFAYILSNPMHIHTCIINKARRNFIMKFPHKISVKNGWLASAAKSHWNKSETTEIALKSIFKMIKLHDMMAYLPHRVGWTKGRQASKQATQVYCLWPTTVSAHPSEIFSLLCLLLIK